jgi:hypothetical protein
MIPLWRAAEFDRDAAFQFCFEVSHLCNVVSHSALEVGGIVQQIYRRADVCEWHLRYHAVLWSAAGATLV